MPNLPEIEDFLADNTRFFPVDEIYNVNWSREQKQDWLIKNAHDTKRIVWKMRGLGHRGWNNFLWAFGLEESVIFIKKQ